MILIPLPKAAPHLPCLFNNINMEMAIGFLEKGKQYIDSLMTYQIFKAVAMLAHAAHPAVVLGWLH